MSGNRNRRGQRRGWQLGLTEGAIFAFLALGIRAATATAAMGGKSIPRGGFEKPGAHEIAERRIRR
jgi:hypothetical protein